MARRILIVDDVPRNVALLVSLLEPSGHTLVTAGGGREALARIEEQLPDLVLLDLEMPDLDGIGVLTHLRAHQRAHVPVIVVTAHGERARRLAAVEAGADDFLDKPIDVALLEARVRTLLELKASRDELARRHAALEALQREQREMLQFIVHDLRTPLLVAQSSVQYAGGSLATDPREALEALRDASDSIIRVNDLVNDVLSVTQLEQAHMQLVPSMVHLDPLVARLTGAYSRKARAREVRLGSHVAPLVVRADEALLRRVLENLLDNSLRHTPAQGEVEVEASEADARVRIAVSNSGPPIALEDREAIFEKFARGSGPGSQPGAVGLGLYFCRRVIEAHGGTIQVERSSRWPTSFVIEMPQV